MTRFLQLFALLSAGSLFAQTSIPEIAFDSAPNLLKLGGGRLKLCLADELVQGHRLRSLRQQRRHGRIRRGRQIERALLQRLEEEEVISATGVDELLDPRLARARNTREAFRIWWRLLCVWQGGSYRVIDLTSSSAPVQQTARCRAARGRRW